MTKNRIFSLSLALALLLSVSFASLDAQAGRFGQPGPGPAAEAYTPEQYEEMRALREAHFDKAAPLYRQLKAKQAELDQLYYSDSKDNSKVQKIFRDMADIEAKLYNLDNEFRSQCEKKGFRRGYGHKGFMGQRGDYQGRGHHFERGDRHGGPRGDYGGHRGNYGGHRGGW